jgi:hypothetical protein
VKDAIHIGGGATIEVYRVGSVGEQAAEIDKAEYQEKRRLISL